jgi:hypothetical protein
MYNEAIHHLIINIDAPGSGQLSNPEKLELRNVIYDVIGQAFQAAGVAVEKCRVEDRGDGALIIVPPKIPETRMIGVWIEEVHQALRAHNGSPGTPRRVRLRLGAHAGQVHTDAHGAAGADVDLACRLADSGAARATLDAAHAAHLVVVVSTVLYESVVRHGGRFIDPECYRKVRVQLKETDTTAWVAVPGYSVPPVSPEDANPSRAAAADRAQHDPADPRAGAAHQGQAFGDIYQRGGNAAYIGQGTFNEPFVVGNFNPRTGNQSGKEEHR